MSVKLHPLDSTMRYTSRMRPGFVAALLVVVGVGAFWGGRVTAPRAPGRVEVREVHDGPRRGAPEPAQPTGPEPALGTPLRTCLDSVSRLDGELRNPAHCAQLKQVTDTQAQAMLALLPEKDRQTLEAVIDTEARGRADASESARRHAASTVADALADRIGIKPDEKPAFDKLLCGSALADRRLRTQLAHGEIPPEDYFPLVKQRRSELEDALQKLIGADRLLSFQELGGADAYPCPGTD